jgi:hypothetical protein
MEYNTQRSKLIVPEYGRSIQKMATHLLSIEDVEKRSRMAKTIVQVMGQLHPEIKGTPDARQKLWDHLHIITNFQLDVDSPFPKPSQELLEKKPNPIPYAQENIPFRHYGKHIIRIIEAVSIMEESPEKENFTKAIANHLKKSYLSWNRESVTDEIIADHLSSLSKGQLKLSDSARLQETSDILARQRKKKFTGKQQNKNRGRKKQDR